MSKVNRDSVTIKVEFDGQESSSLTVSKLNYSYQDFYDYCKIKYNLHDHLLVFYNKDGEEVLPSIETKILKLKAIKNDQHKKKNNENTNISLGKMIVNWCISYAGIFTVLCLAFVCRRKQYDESLNFIENFFNGLIDNFGLNIYKGVIYESFLAFVGWSTTYLFIRRLWNPENGGWTNTMQKFSADSIFGGVCAGATVWVKYFAAHR